ncbi:hypothetical protein GGF50DRAFT_55836 [Schizophyllum commune]
MSISTGGNNATEAPMPSSVKSSSQGNHQQLLHRPLVSHYERMMPLLQIAMHINMFHTEHEDYPFWASTLTYIVEKYMKRTAAVVPQWKLWSKPVKDRKEIEEGKKGASKQQSAPTDESATTSADKTAGAPDAESPTREADEQLETAESPVNSASQESEIAENEEHPTPVLKPRRDKKGLTTALDFPDPDCFPEAEGHSGDALISKGSNKASDVDEEQQQADLDNIANTGSLAAADDQQRSSPPSESDSQALFVEEEYNFDLSMSTNRTTDTGLRKKVITDFGVLTPRYPGMDLDPAQVYSACANVRNDYAGTKIVPHGGPSDFVPQFRAHPDGDGDSGEEAEDLQGDDEDAYPEDEDSDDDDDDDDDDYRPDPPIVTPSASGFTLKLRDRKPAPATPSPDDNLVQADREALDWLERDMLFDESETSLHDEVCNTARAFKEFKDFAKFYVAILCEGKRSPSNKNKKGAFTRKLDVWEHQNNVVGMVMVSDYWCWNEFERIPGRNKVEAKWQDYTDETRPFKTCNPWTRFVQWGSPASDQALANMMERVNQLYPAFSPSPTVDPTTGATPSASETLFASGSSGPTAVATPANAPSSADAPGSANLEIPSGQPADSGEEIRTAEQYQETHEDELSHNDDEARSLPIEHDGATGEPRALDIDVTMHEVELAPNAAADLSDAPSARTPSTRMEYRGMLNSEVDDGPPPLMANVNAAVIGSGPDSRRLYEGGTRATFNDSAVIGLGDDAGQSGDASLKPSDGEEIQGHAQDVSTLSAPLRPVDGSTDGTINSSDRWRRDTASVQPRFINAPEVMTETGSLATPSAPPGASASTTAVPLAPRMHSRESVRTATQDFEPDSGPTGPHTETGDNGTNDRDGQTNTTGSLPLRKSLYGENTQAALDGLASISISSNGNNAALGNNGLNPADVAAVPASVDPAQDGGGGGGGGGNGSGGTGAIPVNPDNPLKRSEPDDPDEDMGEPRAAKKAKRAPAVTEPPAQEGPGSSTQHARGKAAPKRARKKVTVEPSTRTLRSRDKATKKG